MLCISRIRCPEGHQNLVRSRDLIRRSDDPISFFAQLAMLECCQFLASFFLAKSSCLTVSPKFVYQHFLVPCRSGKRSDAYTAAAVLAACAAAWRCNTCLCRSCQGMMSILAVLIGCKEPLGPAHDPRWLPAAQTTVVRIAAICRQGLR